MPVLRVRAHSAGVESTAHPPSEAIAVSEVPLALDGSVAPADDCRVRDPAHPDVTVEGSR